MPVNSQHKDYNSMATRWRRCRDVYQGEDAVHSAGTTYLDKLKDQGNDDYEAYKKRATFYNATYRTITGLKGMIFRIPPKVAVPDAVEEMLDDITMSGVPLISLAQSITEDALEVGRIGIFVDYPQASDGLTKADAAQQNLRPKMVTYKTEDIINWATGRVNNRTVLTQVVLKECHEVPIDEYTTKSVDRYRVLDLPSGVYRVRVFERSNDTDVQIGSDLFPMMNGATMDYIPFVFVGVDDLTPEVDDPPLIDLVNMNLSHYRCTADYEHGCHFTGLPTAVVSGVTLGDQEKLYIGSQEAWVFKSKDAKATYLEFTGSGLSSLKEALDRKEAQMAILGARMLEPQHKGVEAAETLGIRRKGEESMLSTAAQTISEGIELALRWFCEWAGAVSDEVEYELNREFYAVAMSAQELTALVGAWQSGAISMETLFENLKRGDIIAQDVTMEDEQARISDNPPVLSGGLPGGGTPSTVAPMPKPTEKQGVNPS